MSGNDTVALLRRKEWNLLIDRSVLFRRSKTLPLTEILEGCRNQKPAAQKQLFEAYYSFGINICMRYANNREEAEEMFDDGFLRILNKISYYDPDQPFEAWFRTVIIRSAIDHYRKNKTDVTFTDIEEAYDIGQDEGLIERLSAEEILSVLQFLPPSYRTAFSLHVVDGYSHAEIASMLGINEGTSRSNLAKARIKLQELLINWVSNGSINKRNYV
ncbi:RNA polymerase sigma factor [Dyadobacter sp. 3J3]|uniref:RNA polymerase sigma factor n=1 Tax=Dyadobacter sp. 3J3 TaxID=2606600 RepID=UPI001E3A6563|nr:sigma-70 family RNA polymerase sigma factor [Dyadobacter sp. 3J3]